MIKYRFINYTSIQTNESLNVGLIIEKDNENQKIIFLENLEIAQIFFPFINVSHIELAEKLIDIKYKLNKVNNSEIKISNTISLSNTRLYKPSKEELDDIINVLFNKYFMVQQLFNHIKENN